MRAYSLLNLSVTGPRDGLKGVAGQPREFLFVADAPNSSLYTYAINWNDGSPIQNFSSATPISISHTFESAGQFSPSVTVMDSTGRSLSTTLAALTILRFELQGDNIAIGAAASDKSNDTVLVETTTTDGVVRVSVNGVVVNNSQNGLFDLGQTGIVGLRVFGGAGNDQVIIRGEVGDDKFLAFSDRIQIDSLIDSTIYFDNSVENRQLEGMGGNDQFELFPGFIPTVDGGTGSDTITSRLTTGTTTWRIASANQGTMRNSDLVSGLNFSAVESLVGNDRSNDTFVMANTGMLSGSINGGADLNDSLDLTAISTSPSVDFQRRLATNMNSWTGIEQFRATSGSLIGSDADATWILSGINTGTVSTSQSTLNFVGFRNLSGGSSNDNFEMRPAGQIQGTLAGGGGSDALSFAALASVSVLLSTQTSGTGTNVSQFNTIESLIGVGTNSALSGSDTTNQWLIDGKNSGRLNDIAFSGFSRLTGSRQADMFSFTETGSITESISGFSGTNTLSFGSRTTPIRLTANSTSPTAINVIKATVVNATTNVVIVPTYTQINNYVGSQSGGDRLIGQPAATSWGVAGLNSGTIGPGTFTGFEQLFGGLSADTFGISEGASIETIDGGSGTDSLVGPSGSNTWSVSGINSGQLNSIAYALIENLTGGIGDDLFDLLPNGGVTGILSAGAGFNTLSYRQRNTGVAVNLSTSMPTATSVGTVVDSFSMLVGGNGNDNLIGSLSRGMVLVGLAGNDSLTAGAGRDLLIGGLGSDTLQGGAGDDILLGSMPTFQNDLAGLRAIWQEWQSTRSYVERRSNIQGITNGGLNGQYKFKNSSNPAEDTLLNDEAVDTLLGGEGTDWFIASLDDLLDSLQPGEVRDIP